MKYLVIIERNPGGFSAYSPDLPGCVSSGRDLEEVNKNMQDTIAHHLDSLRMEGYDIPEPSSIAEYFDVH